jgi:hypothetical protein
VDNEPLNLEAQPETQPETIPAQPQPTPQPTPQPEKKVAPRDEWIALLNQHFATLTLPFVQDCEKLIDKYFPKE